jgi:hypothetical protein
MSALFSEDDLKRARQDRAFRQQLLAAGLNRLLKELNVMRCANSQSADAARLMREGVDLAVRLADKLQQYGDPGPRAA